MSIEIELKLKVESFEQIVEKLRQIGADFDDDYRQTDHISMTRKIRLWIRIDALDFAGNMITAMRHLS